MSRYLHCRTCADLAGFRSQPASEDGPAEHVRRVDGRPKVPFRCDSCNKVVTPGEMVTAWTIWSSLPDNFPPWERNFLLPQQEDQS